MVAADLFRRCLALLQACPYPAWCYTGDNDAGHLPHGVEFSPDATTVAQWLDLVMKEKDPMVEFHPEGVTPLCEDQEVEAVLRRHPVVVSHMVIMTHLEPFMLYKLK